MKPSRINPMALSAAILGSLTPSGSASASTAFALADLDSDYQQLVGEKGQEGKCGEGKCGSA